jgi:hypothetical protein
MWRIIGAIVGLVFLVSGCSYKSQALYFDPYIPKNHTVASGLTLEKVYLKSVVDLRPSPEVLGTVIDTNGNPTIHAASGEVVSLWLYEALKSGLEARGIAVISKPQKDAKTLVIHLEELQAQYNETLLKTDNLRASMTLKVQITKGANAITKNISQESLQWHKPIRDTAAFKPILQGLMQDVIERTVNEVSKI